MSDRGSNSEPHKHEGGGEETQDAGATKPWLVLQSLVGKLGQQETYYRAAEVCSGYCKSAQLRAKFTATRLNLARIRIERLVAGGRYSVNRAIDAGVIRTRSAIGAAWAAIVAFWGIFWTTPYLICLATIAMAFTSFWQFQAITQTNRSMDDQRQEMARQRAEMARQSTAAEVSAKASQDAAKAAEETVAQSRETAKIQLRAYLAMRMEIVEIKPISDREEWEVVYKLRFKNYGQTPASRVSIFSLCQRVEKNADETEVSIRGQGCEDVPYGGLELAPQQEHAIVHSTNITDSQRTGLKSGRLVWRVEVALQYLDVFDDRQEKTQRFRAGGDSKFDVGEMDGDDDAGIDNAAEPTVPDEDGGAPDAPTDEIPPTLEYEVPRRRRDRLMAPPLPPAIPSAPSFIAAACGLRAANRVFVQASE